MDNINKEVLYVQNPAIGAAILWRFVCGYYAAEKQPTPFPLLFIVLPIIFREELCSTIRTTQKNKGLSKVSEKLFQQRKNDNLLAINNTAIALRNLSLDSLSIATNSKLLAVEHSTALDSVYTSHARQRSQRTMAARLTAPINADRVFA